MSEIVQLYNNDGITKAYPKTLASEVYLDDGATKIMDKFDELNDKIQSIDSSSNSLSGVVKLLEKDSVGYYDSYSLFENNAISICIISDSNSYISQFPDSKSGILITYRFDNSSYNGYQEYYVYETGRKYRRNSIGTQSSFKQDAIEIANGLLLNGDSLPSAFPKKQITIVSTGGFGQTSGLPDTDAGVLKTYKITSVDSNSYQEFTTYSGNKYIRCADYTDSWKDWYRTNIPVVNTSTRNSDSFYKYKGCQCFDTSLNKPIWYDGTNWIDNNSEIV